MHTVFLSGSTVTLQHAIIAPEALHPSLRLASQLAHASARCIDSGHPTLSSQLPGGAVAADLDLHQPQQRRIVGCRTGTAQRQLRRSGSCGAVLFWQNHARGETLRRLHLAAHSGAGQFAGALAAVVAPGPRRARHRIRETPQTAARRAAVFAPASASASAADSFCTAAPCDFGSDFICPSYRSKYSARAGPVTATMPASCWPCRRQRRRRACKPGCGAAASSCWCPKAAVRTPGRA